MTNESPLVGTALNTMTSAEQRLEKIKPALACPNCHGELAFTATAALCAPCSATYSIKAGKIYFVAVPAKSEDAQDQLKERLKRLLGKYYYSVGVDILAPNYPFNFARVVRRHIDPATHLVVDVGSGNNRIAETVICLDLFDYDNVDVICDVYKLPFKPGSVDAFVSRSMLEHVPYPAKVVEQFHRFSKAEALGLHLIPFMMPFHASPYDFQRYTHKGAEVLFHDWNIVEQSTPTGPISLLLNITVEFFSILFSFGNARMKAMVYFGACAIVFPLKFLDVLFINRKSFITMAPSILTVVRKRQS